MLGWTQVLSHHSGSAAAPHLTSWLFLVPMTACLRAGRAQGMQPSIAAVSCRSPRAAAEVRGGPHLPEAWGAACLRALPG